MDLFRCFPSFKNLFYIYFFVLKYFQIYTSHINAVPAPAVLYVVLAPCSSFHVMSFFHGTWPFQTSSVYVAEPSLLGFSSKSSHRKPQHFFGQIMLRNHKRKTASISLTLDC